MLSVLRGLAALVISSVMLAAPAAATQDEFLHTLQDRYNFLTAEQMLTEGYRTCSAVGRGVLAPDAVNMVRADLKIATGAAMDIVSAAVLDLC